jgi:hypothetical protein
MGLGLRREPTTTSGPCDSLYEYDQTECSPHLWLVLSRLYWGRFWRAAARVRVRTEQDGVETHRRFAFPPQTRARMIASSWPEPESLWRKYPGRDAEVGLIEGEESNSLLIRHCTSGRSLCSTSLSLRLVLRLDGMRVDDCPNEPRKALLELHTTRGVVDFHAAALTTDQPRLSQLPKVVGECGLRDRLVADRQKRRAILRAFLRHDVRINCHPYRVGQGVENALYCDVPNRWMEQRPHGDKSSHSGKKVQ